MLLAHPEAEDLGRFVEGTLDDPERTAIVEHIADCDDCRVLVVDAAEFNEPAKTATRPLKNWWIAVAASIVLVIGVGYYQYLHPLTKLAKTYGQLTFAPVEGRLNEFPYVPAKKATRGSSDDELDPDSLKLSEPAADVLDMRGDDARTRHARGVAHLVLKERAPAVEELTAATREAPQEAVYWSDLSAAQIANGDAAHAIESADQALRLHADLPDALFNRALALQTLGSGEAASAYERYVRADSTSRWSDEARKRASDLRSRGD